MLPAICREKGALWLETEPLVLSQVGLAIVGTVGWYDYSGDPAGRSAEQLSAAKGRITADAKRIDWAWDDPSFAAGCQQRLSQSLAAVSLRADVRQILVVTHVPPYAELASQRTVGGEAYYLHPNLGRLINTFPKVTHVVSGHTHWGRQTTIGRSSAADISAQVVDNWSSHGLVELTFPTS